MKKYTLPYFGELDLEDDFFETDIEFEEHEISISVDFEGEPAKKKQLEKVKQLLTQLPDLNEKIKSAIITDYGKTPSFVHDYIGFFHKSLEGSGDYEDFIDEDSDKTPDEQLLEQFYVNNIGIYPDGNTFAVFDYIIDDEQSDDILVVYVNDKGEIDGMTIES